jgi:nucleoside-diphosphate-sugar epimerase
MHGRDTFAVCGGSGFIGRHLTHALANDRAAQVRLLAHRHDPSDGLMASNVMTVSGDLMNPDSLGALMTTGCTVINLAYMSTKSCADNLAAVACLVKACRIGKVRRMVHVSTATVVGAASVDVITEATPPVPRADYEQTKLEIEHVLTEGAQNAFELVILRPTAVFGPQGKNLVKLAAGLLGGSTVANYVRSCLHGRRRMNLVCVDNVVAAIRFATTVPIKSGTETFIVSDDDEDLNNYRDVESILISRFECNDYVVPPLSLPRALFKVLLKCSGRSNANPNRVYSGAKLTNAGFKKATPFTAGLVLFADWYRQTYASSADTVE